MDGLFTTIVPLLIIFFASYGIVSAFNKFGRHKLKRNTKLLIAFWVFSFSVLWLLGRVGIIFYIPLIIAGILTIVRIIKTRYQLLTKQGTDTEAMSLKGGRRRDV